MSPPCANPCENFRPHRHDRLRLDRQGHAAADRAPFRLRQVALRHHRSARGRRAREAARRALHQAGGDQGQLSRAAGAAAHRRRRPGLLRQSVGRHLLGRHHDAVPRDRRALCRHRGRAVARLLFRQEHRPREALQLRAARDAAGGQAQEPGRHHRGLHLRRQSRHGVLVRQAGAARHRPRHQHAVQRAEEPRRLGPSSRRSSASRASISPSATPSAPRSRSR